MKYAKDIVKEIIEDFTCRRGLRQEWEQIDEETQKKIRKTWIDIVNKKRIKSHV